MVSPLKKAASANVMKGCNNCTCETRAMPPIAMPAFHAKNPIHCENSATYSSASHGFNAICVKSAGMVSAAAGSEIGNATTSAQLITSHPGMRAVSRPE